MARKKSEKRSGKGEIANFESLKDKTGPLKKEKLDKAIQLQEKKRVETITAKKKGIPLAYAALIIIVIAALGAVLLFANPQVSSAPVKAGDMVQILYVLKLENGSVFDAGNFSFRVNSSEVIEGVDEALIGMKVGEKKTITVTPEKAYGYYDENKVYDVPLDDEMNVTEKLTVEQFNETFGEEPELHRLYRLEGMAWDMRVEKIENDTVTLIHQPEDGMVFDLKDMYGNVYGTAEVTTAGDVIKVHTVPIRGATIATLLGQGRIVDFNETHMKMDFNHPLASKKLTFEITLLNMISY